MYVYGFNTPAIRGLLAAAAAAAALWYTKPAAFFDPATGRPLTARWNAVRAGFADDAPELTPLPWYAASALVGAAVILASGEFR